MARDTHEKREFLRIPFHAEVEINARQFSCRSESDIDVSMTGLRMAYGEAAPPAGSQCLLSLFLQPLDEQVVIDAAGRIVRSEPGSIAVEFTGLDPDSFYHLRQLILNNAGDPEKAESELNAHWGIRRPRHSTKEPS